MCEIVVLQSFCFFIFLFLVLCIFFPPPFLYSFLFYFHLHLIYFDLSVITFHFPKPFIFYLFCLYVFFFRWPYLVVFVAPITKSFHAARFILALQFSANLALVALVALECPHSGPSQAPKNWPHFIAFSSPSPPPLHIF